MGDTVNDPAFEAARRGQLEQLRHQVEVIGVDVRTHDSLWGAAANGHEAVVRYLATRGADVRMLEDVAVRVAAEDGHLGTVKFLVSVGANIRVWGDYCMWRAGIEGFMDLMRYLVALGADAANRAFCDDAITERNFEIAWYLVLRGSPKVIVPDKLLKWRDAPIPYYVAHWDRVVLDADRFIRDRARACAQAEPASARRVGLWWAPRGSDPTRRSGRRAARRRSRTQQRSRLLNLKTP